MRVEGVRVEQVQRVVEHRVPDPRDLPGRAHRVAEIGRDAARQVQHERPGREHREQHAGRARRARARGRRSTARAPSARGLPRPRLRTRRVRPPSASRRRRRASAGAAIPAGLRRAGETGAHGLRVSGATRIGAAYGSAPETLRRIGRRRVSARVARVCVRLPAVRVLVVGAGGVGAAFAAIAQRRPVFEQVVLADVALERAAGGGRAPRRARPLHAPSASTPRTSASSSS